MSRKRRAEYLENKLSSNTSPVSQVPNASYLDMHPCTDEESLGEGCGSGDDGSVGFGGEGCRDYSGGGYMDEGSVTVRGEGYSDGENGGGEQCSEIYSPVRNIMTNVENGLECVGGGMRDGGGEGDSMLMADLHHRMTVLENHVPQLQCKIGAIGNTRRNNNNTCHLYVSVNNPTCSCAEVPNFIGCPALQVVPLAPKCNASSFKVKIERSSLWKALSNEAKGVRIHLWKTRSGLKVTLPSRGPRQTSPAEKMQTLSVASWNCRGMGQSEPYLKILTRSAHSRALALAI